jgi:hypothetical protein
MSLEYDSKNNSSQAQSNTNQNQTQSRTSDQRTRGLNALAALQGTGNNRGNIHEYTEAVHAAVCANVKRAGETLSASVGLDVTLIDNKSHAFLALSAVVINLTDSVSKTTMSYALLIEGSRKLNPIRLEHVMPPVELDRPAADCYDDQTVSIVIDYLKSQYPGHKINLIGSNVVPTSLSSRPNLNEDSDLALMVFHAINANLVKLDRALGGNEFALSVVDIVGDSNVQVEAKIDVSPVTRYNASGDPLRSDCVVEIGVANRSNNSSAKFSSETGITEAVAYVDLSYIDPEKLPRAHQNQMPDQRYRARVVITSLDSPKLAAVTPETFALALSSITTLDRDNSWMRLMMPNFGKTNGIDKRAIGAIGYECAHLTDDGLPAFIDVSGESVNATPGVLADLLRTAVLPGLIYSMDITACSELGWLHGALLAAAKGHPEAQADLHKAFDTLTAGNFSRNIDRDKPIVFNEQTLIPMGYYFDENDQKRDLRDFDHLAMLNIYGPKGDISVVETFDGCLDDQEVPVLIRLNTYIDLLKKTIGKSVTVTGWAWRVTFNNEALSALNNALAACGFNARSNNLGTFVSGTGRRGNSVALQQSVIMNHYTSVGNGNSYGSVGNYNTFIPRY